MTIKNILAQSASPFDSIVRIDEGKEYWLARELMPLLGYKEWDRVPDVINRAMAACENSGNLVPENFSEEARKTKGRPQQDYRLSRYACYLVAMNGDPRKTEIAQAQTYFAIKTREAETQQAAQQLPRQLPPVRDAIEYLDASERINNLSDPLMRSLLNQRVFEELASKALPANTTTQVILTARATELGYHQSQIGNGSQLGKFVSKMISPNGKTQHGRYPVNVYDLTPELDECIHAYFR